MAIIRQTSSVSRTANGTLTFDPPCRCWCSSTNGRRLINPVFDDSWPYIDGSDQSTGRSHLKGKEPGLKWPIRNMLSDSFLVAVFRTAYQHTNLTISAVYSMYTVYSMAWDILLKLSGTFIYIQHRLFPSSFTSNKQEKNSINVAKLNLVVNSN